MTTNFTDLINLAAEQLGASVVAANDEFFAPKEGMLKPTPAEWREGVYTERGKWMDGWETRRRRTPGYDWAIIKLGTPGVVRGVDIDTSFYTGNYPEHASIDGVNVSGVPSVATLTSETTSWRELLPKSQLAGNTQNPFAVESSDVVTHLRLNIYPDGGVARFRVYGDVHPDPRRLEGLVDLAAMENGGYVEVCSDMHYGDRQNLILPGRSTHMGNGWETKRRRAPGNEWTVLRLAKRGIVERVELDTDHYKGNAPGACSLQMSDDGGHTWRELVPRTPVEPHARHIFEPASREPATHIRLDIYPDGGVARLRLMGRVAT